MTKINSKKAIFVLIVILLISVVVINEEKRLTEREIEQSTPQRLTSQIDYNQEATYIIDTGEGVLSYKVGILEDSTVFSLLQELAEQENFQIEFTIYPEMGVLVESIDGYKNGTDNKYWQYWLNEELPMIAADKKEVKGGDEVEWRFAPTPF